MKKLFIILCIICVSVITGCENNLEPNQLTIDATPTPQQTENVSIQETISFDIVNGEQGEYGKSRTINKNTEFEKTFFEYHIPTGTYTVSNKAETGACQISVYSDEYIKVDGVDEPKETIATVVVFANESATISLSEGQHLKLSDGSETLSFKQQ